MSTRLTNRPVTPRPIPHTHHVSLFRKTFKKMVTLQPHRFQIRGLTCNWGWVLGRRIKTKPACRRMAPARLSSVILWEGCQFCLPHKSPVGQPKESVSISERRSERALKLGGRCFEEMQGRYLPASPSPILGQEKTWPPAHRPPWPPGRPVEKKQPLALNMNNSIISVNIFS